eukprot:scaffold85274_cov24-Tisochrysis_lutea.AAC.1
MVARVLSTDLKPLPLQQGVGLHGPVLVGGADHGKAQATFHSTEQVAQALCAGCVSIDHLVAMQLNLPLESRSVGCGWCARPHPVGCVHAPNVHRRAGPSAPRPVLSVCAATPSVLPSQERDT